MSSSNDKVNADVAAPHPDDEVEMQLDEEKGVVTASAGSGGGNNDDGGATGNTKDAKTFKRTYTPDGQELLTPLLLSPENEKSVLKPHQLLVTSKNVYEVCVYTKCQKPVPSVTMIVCAELVGLPPFDAYILFQQASLWACRLCVMADSVTNTILRYETQRERERERERENQNTYKMAVAVM